MPSNWYSAWLPNSEAAKRKPVLSTQTEAHTGMVSKYLILSSVTISELRGGGRGGVRGVSLLG
jgi:hypothetical protein